MDPNTALELMRNAIKNWRNGFDKAEVFEHLVIVAQQAEALDEWLSRGGFPPEAWREGPDAHGQTDSLMPYKLS
jgi:hypothetical protein